MARRTRGSRISRTGHSCTSRSIPFERLASKPLRPLRRGLRRSFPRKGSAAHRPDRGDHVSLDSTITGKLFCLITDLHDHQTHPAHLLAAAYRWRWDGTETALREAKSTINGAGPGTGAMLRSGTPDLIDQEHAAWTIATEVIRATLRSATTIAAPFAKGLRTGQSVKARHLSFTTARRTVLATVRAGTATASLPSTTRTAAHQRALHQIAKARITTDSNRHRPERSRAVNRSGTPQPTPPPAPSPPRTPPSPRPHLSKVEPGANRRALDAARAEQTTKQWQTRYARRSGVEATIAQATKVTDTRRARYRGRAKTNLDHNIKAVALNLIRLDAWWNGEALAPRRTSHLSRLELALAA